MAENVPDSAEGVILESVLEGMAEYYSLQLSQNVKRGLLESAKKHHVIGGHLPLGYNMGQDKTFVIDPKTAPTVKLIFDMYAAGSTVTEVIAYLNGHGYRTKAGKPFTRNSLSVVLKMKSTSESMNTKTSSGMRMRYRPLWIKKHSTKSRKCSKSTAGCRPIAGAIRTIC